MQISFHTDAFNTSFTDFQPCVDRAEQNDVHWIECEGRGGPLLEKSLTWLRSTLDELGIPEEKA